MRLPAQLSRKNKDSHKNDFGHALILAGSKKMLGAAALTSLACMRSGCGLVTVGIPKSLNSVIQKKISSVIMTLPLKETPDQTLDHSAIIEIERSYTKYTAIALGPGLSTHPKTQKLILKIISSSPRPITIDADGLNAVAENLDVLTKTNTPKILTPHLGEFKKLIDLKKNIILKDRERYASNFAKKFRCVLLLKGHQTLVVNENGEIYINKTGNAGMATAGSGDVLTGIITAFVAQGLSAYEAAKYGAYIHGKAGDLAAKNKGRISLIASDIIESLPKVLKS